MGTKEIGDRTGLLWKLSDKKRARETYVDESLKGQVKNRTQERKDLWRVVRSGFAGKKPEEEQRAARRAVLCKTKNTVHRTCRNMH